MAVVPRLPALGNIPIRAAVRRLSGSLPRLALADEAASNG
jgi:hypothetical protein